MALLVAIVVAIAKQSVGGAFASVLDGVGGALMVAAVVVGLALAPIGVVLHWVGIDRVARAAGDDVDLGFSARRALLVSVPTILAAVALSALKPPWTTGPITLCVGLVGCAALLAQRISLAQLRVIVQRRQGGAPHRIWPAAAAFSILATGICITAMGRAEPLLPPLVLIVAAFGLASELGNFAAAEGHVLKLAVSKLAATAAGAASQPPLSPSGRGDPS